MARARKEEQFCLHDSGVVTVDSDGMHCEDCGTRLVLVSQTYLDSLTRHLAEVRQDLRDCRRGITKWAGE